MNGQPVERDASAPQGGLGRPLILLSGDDLRAVLRPATAIEALRRAYVALADNPGDAGRSIGFAIDGGSIHVKSGLLPGSHAAFASKVNVNRPRNRAENGLPTIQGIVIVCDPRDGRPLAVMESTALTGLRTAAAAALAAQHGARADSTRLAIIGCGAQAAYQLQAMRAVLAIDEVRLFDTAHDVAEAFAAAHATAGCRLSVAPSAQAAVTGVDVCVTCTTATAPVLTDDMGLAGCFVAAIGADNPGKHEIAPGLFRRARILADDAEACAAGGDLAHVPHDGALAPAHVHADLAELVSGRKRGRLSADELVIYDSVGSGVQDVAVAWSAYQEAVRTGRGTRFALGGAPASSAFA